MVFAEILKELFRILLLDIRCGDCNSDQLQLKQQTCLRCRSHFARRPLLLDDMHLSSHFALTSNISRSTRHTLLWRLSSPPKLYERKHNTDIRCSYCNAISHPSESSPLCQLRKFTSPPLNQLPLLSPFLTVHSATMCRWNPNSQHPFRRCTHGHWHHEELPMLERTTDVPAVWCNKCWTLCAFESSERVVPRTFLLSILPFLTLRTFLDDPG